MGDVDLIIAPFLNNGDNGHQWAVAGMEWPWPPYQLYKTRDKQDRQEVEGGREKKNEVASGEMATTNVRLHVREKEKGRAQSSDRRTGELAHNKQRVGKVSAGKGE